MEELDMFEILTSSVLNDEICSKVYVLNIDTYNKGLYLNTFNANRVINKHNVDEIFDAIKTDYKSFPPIIVDRKTLNILDGQHRYNAAVKCWENNLNIELKVLIMDLDNPEYFAITLNSTGRKWILSDYINYYARDNENYSKIIEFGKSYELFKSNRNELKYNDIISILVGNFDTKSCKQGNLIINDKNIEEGALIMQYVEVIINKMKMYCHLYGNDVKKINSKINGVFLKCMRDIIIKNKFPISIEEFTTRINKSKFYIEKYSHASLCKTYLLELFEGLHEVQSR